MNAARVNAGAQFISPVVGVGEELVALDPALADNQLVNPSAEVRDSAIAWRALTDEEDQEYSGHVRRRGPGLARLGDRTGEGRDDGGHGRRGETAQARRRTC